MSDKKRIPKGEREKIEKLLCFALNDNGNANEQSVAMSKASKRLSAFGWTTDEFCASLMVVGRDPMLSPRTGDYFSGDRYYTYILSVYEEVSLLNGKEVGDDYYVEYLSHTFMLPLDKAIELVMDRSDRETPFNLGLFRIRLEHWNDFIRSRNSRLLSRGPDIPIKKRYTSNWNNYKDDSRYKIFINIAKKISRIANEIFIDNWRLMIFCLLLAGVLNFIGIF